MTSQRASTVLIWAARAAWIGALVLGPNALDRATGPVAVAHRPTTSWIALATAVTIWVLGLACVTLASTATLALGRLLTPFAVAFSAVITVAADGAAEAIGVLMCTVVTAAALWSGDVGDAFVQASAYGDERRFLLRAPRVYFLLGALNWIVATASLLTGGLRLAIGQWIVGGLLVGLGVGACAFGWPRWHRLARRWLVLVPAGVVFHDHVLLADTTMWRWGQIKSATVATKTTKTTMGSGSGSGSFDLTGSAWGESVEIETVRSETIVLAARPSRPTGIAVHLTSVRVTPARPGRFIRSAATRGISVGEPTGSHA